MSNPLLKPGDPRFSKPSLIDAAGQNRFADQDPAEENSPDSATASDASQSAEPYVAPSASSELPFQPHYETTAASRETLHLILASIGLAGALSGAASLLGIFHLGWFVPLCAVVASASAAVMAYKDLGEMHVGGRDSQGRQFTLLAMWLGMCGLLACIMAVSWMIVLEMSLFPDIL